LDEAAPLRQIEAMSEPKHEPLPLEEALVRASNELGLQDYYRDCVRPLLKMPEEQWPRCCGSTCEPCNQLLVNVATRTLTLMGQ
jgi:hypothetical protein